MLKVHKKFLYPNCKEVQKKLASTTLELLQWKEIKNGVSNKGFGELIKIIKNMLLNDDG
jgi:hypothetical protein